MTVNKIYFNNNKYVLVPRYPQSFIIPEGTVLTYGSNSSADSNGPTWYNATVLQDIKVNCIGYDQTYKNSYLFENPEEYQTKAKMQLADANKTKVKLISGSVHISDVKDVIWDYGPY